ncbi:hypothetical protein AWI31_11890 [Enterobacter hormaechei subsp. xiangfangensis]|nr:hypothetical protein AWI31_11890 [Enterobacter hormaechei subsp. xiangfangensis]
MRVWRSLSGAQQLAGAVGLDDPAGTDGEPKVAMVLPVLSFRTYSRRKSTENNSCQTIHRTEQDQNKRVNSTRRTQKGGASAQPFSSAPQGRDVFAAQKAGLSPALHTVTRPA